MNCNRTLIANMHKINPPYAILTCNPNGVNVDITPKTIYNNAKDVVLFFTSKEDFYEKLSDYIQPNYTDISFESDSLVLISMPSLPGYIMASHIYPIEFFHCQMKKNILL